MTRPLRLEVAGGLFHVISRGNAKQRVFRDDHDCRAFLLLLQQTCRRLGWECLTYCLMVNHFHLVLRTPEPNLGIGMRDLKGIYAQGFNGRHGTHDHVWGGRYKSQLVQDGGYFRTLVQYVVLNPCRAGLVSDPRDWRWSSHSSVMDGRRDPAVRADLLLQRFGSAGRSPLEDYTALIYDPIVTLHPSCAPIVGDKAFIAEHAPPQRPAAEVAKEAWEIARPSLEELRAEFPGPEFFRQARTVYRYTLREVAQAAGVSTETVRRRCGMCGPDPIGGGEGDGSRPCRRT